MNFNPIQNIYMYFFNEEDILSKVWHKMASQKLKIGMELDLGEETEYCPCWRQTSKEEGQFDHHQDQHQHHQCLSLYLMERMHSEKLFGCLFCRSYGRTSEAACSQEELAASK